MCGNIFGESKQLSSQELLSMHLSLHTRHQEIRWYHYEVPAYETGIHEETAELYLVCMKPIVNK